jgi:hypothetical protein
MRIPICCFFSEESLQQRGNRPHGPGDEYHHIIITLPTTPSKISVPPIEWGDKQETQIKIILRNENISIHTPIHNHPTLFSASILTVCCRRPKPKTALCPSGVPTPNRILLGNQHCRILLKYRHCCILLEYQPKRSHLTEVPDGPHLTEVPVGLDPTEVPVCCRIPRRCQLMK